MKGKVKTDNSLMAQRTISLILIVALQLLLCACVGPTSPFGALEIGTGDGLFFKLLNSEIDNEQLLSFEPRRQVLHEPRNLEVIINSDHKKVDLEKQNVRVEYNGRDVTHAFSKRIRYSIANDEGKVMLAYKDLRLSPSKSHEILFYYGIDGSKKFIRSEFLPPTCLIQSQKDILTTEPFQAKEEYLELIKKHAKQHKVNPALLAALVAQESGFNLQAKSRKNALGLTQITNLAAEEIEAVKPEWRNRRGENSIVDWRGTPSDSIEGGAIYLEYLVDYWSDETAKKLLIQNNLTESTPVLLASYNSGAARVKKNLTDHGQQWLEKENLKEAFRYVNSVTSYCYHFAGEQE